MAKQTEVQGRNPFLYIGTGQKGSGKSYYSLHELMMKYPLPHNKGGQNKNVLIFDTNDEYPQFDTVYFDITASRQEGKKSIPYPKAIAEHVVTWCVETHQKKQKPSIKRIVPFRPNREEMTPSEKRLTAEILLKYFKGGLLLLEDLNTYMLGAKTTETIGAITTNRHRNQDIMIHLQSLSALDPRLWQNVNVIRMHHQPDPVKRIENKLTNPELFQIAKNIVDENYKTNKYTFVTIMPQENKLYNVSKEDFEKGCSTYLNSNPSIRKRYENIELNGKKPQSQKDVLATFISDKMEYMAAS